MIYNNIPRVINNERFLYAGGKLLGLEVIDFIIKSGIKIKTPIYEYLTIKQIKYNSEKDIKRILTSNILKQKPYTFKYSTIDDDFSSYSIRGKNSSLGRKCNINDILICKNIITRSPKNTKAVIFQEYINCKDLYFIAHIQKNKIKIEIQTKNNVFAILLNKNYDVIFCNKKYNNNIIGDFLQYVENVDFFNIYNLLGFDFNIEGCLKNKEIYIIQLRPIPIDEVWDNNNYKLISKFKVLKKKYYETIFTFNYFYYKMGEKNSLNEIKKNIFTDKKERIIINQSGKNIIEDSFFLNLLKKRKVILVDTEQAFCLSHSPKHIPKDLSLRKNFAYLYIPLKYSYVFFSRDYILISDGQKCCFFK